MHRLLSLVLPALLGAVAVAETPTSAPASSPSQQPLARGAVLYTEKDEWNFGSVWYGEKPETQIRLRNTGDAPLQILEVTTGCTCTTGSVTKSTLQPGEEDVLKIAFDTTRTRDRFPERQLTIRTDAPGRENVHIRIKGESKPLIEFDPPLMRGAILIGRVPHDVPKNLEFDIKVTYDKPVNLKLSDGENPWYDFALREMQAGQHYKLLLISKTPFKIGQMKTSVKLATGMEAPGELEIPLDGFALDRVMAIPDYIRVPQGRSVPTDYNLMIIFRKELPLEVQKISGNFPGVEIKSMKPPRPLRGGESFNMIEAKVTLPPGSAIPVDGSGKLSVSTNVPGYELVIVPVRHDRPSDEDQFRSALVGESPR